MVDRIGKALDLLVCVSGRVFGIHFRTDFLSPSVQHTVNRHFLPKEETSFSKKIKKRVLVNPVDIQKSLKGSMPLTI